MASTERKSAAERDLRFLRLDHFTVPVRDFNVARKFYCEVLGGVVTQEADWGRHETGRAFGAHLDFQVFNDEGHLIAYWQPWGQPALDQVFPHRAFRVAEAARLDKFKSRLESAGVPYVLVTAAPAREGTLAPVSLYFRDPDMNQLELRCEAYPFRDDIRVGTFDPTVQYYRWADWRAMVADGGGSERRAGFGGFGPRG